MYNSMLKAFCLQQVKACFALQYVRNVIFWLLLFLTRNYYAIFSDFLPVIGHIFLLLHLSSIFKSMLEIVISHRCVSGFCCLSDFCLLNSLLNFCTLLDSLPCGMVWRLPLSRKPEWSQDHFIWFFLRDNFNELLIFQYLKAWGFFPTFCLIF